MSLRPGRRGRSTAPDAVVILGALTSLAGYLLPWFRMQSGYAYLDGVAELPFGIGLPVPALGLGLLLVGAVRAVVRTTITSAAAGSVAATE